MAEQERPQSENENLDQLLTADEKPAEQTQEPVSNLIDLGDGSKVSVDDLKVAYQKIKEYEGVDPAFVKQSLEFKQWLTANPDKAKKIRDIASAIKEQEAKSEAPLSEQEKINKRIEELENRDADREMNNDIQTAKKWVEERGIKWDDTLRGKVLQRIVQTGDEVEDALKVVCFEGVVSSKSKPKPANTFIEGKSGGQRTLTGKPVTQMSDAEIRDAIAQDLKL